MQNIHKLYFGLISFIAASVIAITSAVIIGKIGTLVIISDSEYAQHNIQNYNEKECQGQDYTNKEKQFKNARRNYTMH